MAIKDYRPTPENIPRILSLGYLRFVVLFGVLPTTVLLPILIPLNHWLTTRGSIYAVDILDLFDLAREAAVMAPILGALIGTMMWFGLLGTGARTIVYCEGSRPLTKWLAAAFVLTGLVLGGMVGIEVGKWIYRTRIADWEDSQIAYGAAWYDLVNARDLYLNGAYPTARGALLQHIKVLSDIQDRNLAYTGFLEPRVEMAHTYARLSLLEESNGHADQAAKYWDMCVDLLESTGWKQVDRDKVLRMLKVTDGALPAGIREPDPPARR